MVSVSSFSLNKDVQFLVYRCFSMYLGCSVNTLLELER